MELNVQMLSIIGAAIAVSFGAIGPAFGEGRAIAAAMDLCISFTPYRRTIGRIDRDSFEGIF